MKVYTTLTKDSKDRRVASLVSESDAGRKWILFRSFDLEEVERFRNDPEALLKRTSNPTDQDIELRIQNPVDGWPA